MGLLKIFKRFYRSKTFSIPKENHEIKISTSDRFLQVWEINFFGPFSQSMNEEYIVGWQDADYIGGSRGGNRESGFGRVILLKNNRLLFHVDMERPNDGCVANNGRVTVNDWRFGLNLDGIFYVLEKDGNVLIKHPIRANINKSGISEDGQFAWCNTAFSEDENDRNKLFLFASSPPRLLFKIEETNPPEKIESRGNEILITTHGFVRRYSINGALLNPDDVKNAEKVYTIEHGSGYDLFYMAEKILKEKPIKDLNEEELREVNELCQKALQRDVSDSYKATIHRFLGELAENSNNDVEALKQYTVAIEYDPKVGCKRSLSRVEKRLKSKDKNG